MAYNYTSCLGLVEVGQSRPRMARPRMASAVVGGDSGIEYWSLGSLAKVGCNS